MALSKARAYECRLRFEVFNKLIWVKGKLGIERWEFLSVYKSGSDRSEKKREHIWVSLIECIERVLELSTTW